MPDSTGEGVALPSGIEPDTQSLEGFAGHPVLGALVELVRIELTMLRCKRSSIPFTYNPKSMGRLTRLALAKIRSTI